MATQIQTTEALKIFNPSAIYVTPFSGSSLGNKTYKLTEVIKDSTSITQDDPTETKIENEFGSAAIISNVALGEYKFSAQVADMNKDYVKEMCGFTVGTTATDRLFAPDVYVPIYAQIALTFKISSSKTVAAVLPKVQLNSKTTFESLSSNMGTITLAGTGQNMAVSDGVTQRNTPFYIDTEWTEDDISDGK